MNRTALALALTLVPTAAFAGGDEMIFRSSTFHIWDLETCEYYLSDGTDDSYDSMGYFYVDDGTDSYYYEDDSCAPTVSADGQEARGAVDTLGGSDELEVHQSWYFPTDQPYARQTVILRNVSGADFTFDAVIEGNMGSDDETTVLDTSSGDAVLDATDSWVTSYELDGTDPHLGFIWGDGTLAISNDPDFGEGDPGDFEDDLELRWDDVTLSDGAWMAITVVYFQADDADQLDVDFDALAATAYRAHTAGLTDDEILAVANFDLTDLDGDGDATEVFGGTDCDDDNANNAGTGTETCDELDNDCDGVVDNGVTTTYYPDTDGDGAGDDAGAIEACAAPDETWIETAGDCDDNDDDNNPSASEICGDAEDNDCDGEADEADCTDLTPDAGDDDDDDGNGGGCNNSIAASEAPQAGLLLLAPLALLARRGRRRD